MKAKIAVLEGDGIGPEIMAEGLKVLDAIAARYNHDFEYIKCAFGAAAYFTEGSACPDQTRQICDEADTIIKGPVGIAVREMNRIPTEERPELAVLEMRERYTTFANYRPAKLPVSLADFSPLREERLGEGIDILMIRELTGDVYFGKKREGEDTGMQFAQDDCVYTEEQIRRVATTAFGEAQARNVRLTNIDKANVLATSRFWREIVEETACSFPDVPLQHMLVDNAAYQLVIDPTQFNGVMLLGNMNGDILSDQAGGIIGSLGLMPSACVGPEKVFVEPVHGAAPDIAGTGQANPYSMIGSAALMLEKGLGLKEESDLIWDSLFDVFEQGYVTAELAAAVKQGTVLSTSEFGDRVVSAIQAA